MIDRAAAVADEPETLSPTDLHRIDAYWRAANYLSVGQIYLLDNPLLREPLTLAHVKPRLLGHWGTTPGLNFIYVHLNRVIVEHDLDMLFICGPGHGGPGVVANVYLEGTYSEVYPEVSRDEAGLRRLMKQFSFPGGVPSHVAPETPGSIHEGGELGYSRMRTVPSSTTRSSLHAASWATVRQRRVRSPRAGCRTSS
jgi:xylulose-5-phosphate/fructose-6-phosphate phosphoketolase